MNTNLVERSELIINRIFENNKERTKIVSQGLEPKHSKDVKNWVLRLNPQASESLQIAALGHDIDRVLGDEYGAGYKGNIDIEKYKKYKKQHSKRSAAIISENLDSAGFPKQIVNRVKYLIENHDNFDISNDEELELLKAADSLSFFTTFSNYYFKRYGIEKTRMKIKFMINRLPKKYRQIIKNLEIKNPIIKQIVKKILGDANG